MKKYPLVQNRVRNKLPEFIHYPEAKDKAVVLNFNSIQQIAIFIEKYINSLPTTSGTASRKEGKKWSGTDTLQEALDLVMGRDVKEFTEAQEEIKNTVINKLRKMGMVSDWICETFSYDVEGEELDIVKYIEGDTDCYISSTKEYKSTFYDLTVSFNFSHSMDIEAIASNIYTILKVVKELEQEKGIQIRINGVILITSADIDGTDLHVYFPLKDFDKPLDIQAVISVVYPSFFRRVIFALMEIVFGNKLASNYGRSISNYKHIIAISTPKLSEEDISTRVMRTICE